MLFKKTQIKNQLTKLIKASAKLVEDRDNYKLTTKDLPSIQEAVISKFDLEIERIARIFDELKMQYPDFNTIKSTKDHWKFQRPQNADYSVFNADPNFDLPTIDFDDIYRIMSKPHNKYEKKVESTTARPFLKKALTAKYKATLEKECTDLCESYDLNVSSLNAINAAYLITFMSTFDDDELVSIRYGTFYGSYPNKLANIIKHHIIRV